MTIDEANGGQTPHRPAKDISREQAYIGQGQLANPAAQCRPTEPNPRLRWFPGRYGESLADAATMILAVALAPKQPAAGPSAWICSVAGEHQGDIFHGTRAEAQIHLEGLVRDRLIKALAAFGEQEASPQPVAVPEPPPEANALITPHLFVGRSGGTCYLCPHPRDHDIHPNRGTP